MSIFSLRTLAALSCAAALVSACGDSAPHQKGEAQDGEDAATSGAEPADGDAPDGAGGDGEPDGEPDSGHDAGNPPEPMLPTGVVIGTEGGMLALDGIAEVEVPSTALIDDVTLQAREIPAAQLPTPLPLEVVADALELTPHGQLFDLPITVRIQYDPSANPDNLVVMRLDDASDVDWEIVEGATFEDGVASFETTTFSYYTVVTFPESVCNDVPSATPACGGSCTVEQYCSSAASCTAIARDNLCGNGTIYAVHGGETTVDNPSAEALAAAFAAACGTTYSVASTANTSTIHPCSGEPLVGGGNTMFLAGGPWTNLMLRYLDRRISPVFLDTDGTLQQYKTRGGNVLHSFDPANLSPSHDYFLLQIFPDTKRGALVISAFGRDGPGTKAATWYFTNMVLPTFASRSWGKYLVVEWTDSGDMVPNAQDTWTIRASDPLPPIAPPPPVVETPYQPNATGSLLVNQSVNAAAGYKFTPQVNGKITALGGYFNGSKTVKLFRGSTLLATATVSGTNSWVYKDLATPISVVAGTQYTVAVYLGGSGGAKRSSGPTLPQIYGNIRIDAPTQASTSFFTPNAVPTTSSSPTTTMLGLADVKFVAD